MYFYLDALEARDQYPYFGYGYRLGFALCPECKSPALASGKGESIKCLNCGKHFSVLDNLDQQKIYGEILLQDAEERMREHDPKRALTRLRKAEKVYQKLSEKGDTKSQEILFEVLSRIAACYNWLKDSRSLKIEEKAIHQLKKNLEREETDIFYALLSKAYRNASTFAYETYRMDLFESYLDDSVEAMAKALNHASDQNKRILNSAYSGLLEDLGKVMERSAQHADKEDALYFWPKALHFYKPLLSFLKDQEVDNPREKISQNKIISRLSAKISEIEKKIPKSANQNRKAERSLTGLSPSKTVPEESKMQPEKISVSTRDRDVQTLKKEELQEKNLLAGLVKHYLDLARDQISHRQSVKAISTLEQCMNFLDSPVFQEADLSDMAKTRLYTKTLMECAGLLESLDQKEKTLALYQKIFSSLESSQERDFLPFKAKAAFKIALDKPGQNRKEERKNWQRALELSQKLLKEAKDQPEKLVALKQLYTINEHLAASSLKDNQFKKAMHQYKDALSAAEQIRKIEPGEESLQLCLQITNELADAYESRHVKDQARKYRVKAQALEKERKDGQNEAGSHRTR